jgi:hypothetical protein
MQHPFRPCNFTATPYDLPYRHLFSHATSWRLSRISPTTIYILIRDPTITTNSVHVVTHHETLYLRPLPFPIHLKPSTSKPPLHRQQCFHTSTSSLTSSMGWAWKTTNEPMKIEGCIPVTPPESVVWDCVDVRLRITLSSRHHLSEHHLIFHPVIAHHQKTDHSLLTWHTI